MHRIDWKRAVETAEEIPESVMVCRARDHAIAPGVCQCLDDGYLLVDWNNQWETAHWWLNNPDLSF